MSGYDRWVIGELLKEKGWTEHPSGEGLVPPEKLWAERPQKFQPYDADSLQELLAPEPQTDDD